MMIWTHKQKTLKGARANSPALTTGIRDLLSIAWDALNAIPRRRSGDGGVVVKAKGNSVMFCSKCIVEIVQGL